MQSTESKWGSSVCTFFHSILGCACSAALIQLVRFDVYMLAVTHCSVVVLGDASLMLKSVGMIGNTKEVQITCNPTYCKLKLILKHM